jgi:hypothetical protein
MSGDPPLCVRPRYLYRGIPRASGHALTHLGGRTQRLCRPFAARSHKVATGLHQRCRSCARCLYRPFYVSSLPISFRPMLCEQYLASGRVPLGVFWQTMHLSALKDPHRGRGLPLRPKSGFEHFLRRAAIFRPNAQRKSINSADFVLSHSLAICPLRQIMVSTIHTYRPGVDGSVDFAQPSARRALALPACDVSI